MSDIKIYENSEFGEVRVKLIGGEPWFVGKDVATALGYKDTVNALKSHVDDEDKAGWQITTQFGDKLAIFINESGLYSLILSSQLPTAKKFKHWVTAEVLPSIRKTGSFSLQIPQTYQEALRALADKIDESEAQKKKLAEQKPKVDYFDKLVDRNMLVNFTTLAKQLHIKRKELIENLVHDGYIYRDANNNILPYSDKTDLFGIRNWAKDSTAGVQTLINPKGQETFRLLYGKEDISEDL